MLTHNFNRRHFIVAPSHAPLLFAISLFCLRERLIIIIKRVRTLIIITPVLLTRLFLIYEIIVIDSARLVRNNTRVRYIVSFYWLIAAESFAFFSLLFSWFTKRAWITTLRIRRYIERTPIPSALRLRLINSALLLSSSVTVTYSHIRLAIRSIKKTISRLIYTIVLRILFLTVQWVEFSESSISISDSYYRALLFSSLRFHRIHVLVRVIFLIVAYWRIISGNSTPLNHPTYLCAVIYWHFVDVVWVFVYFSYYLAL